MELKNRRQSVMDALRLRKSVKVAELAQELNVSEMTIRRDLKRLADMSIVTLVHGGAVLNEGTTALPNIKARSQKMTKEKNNIASYCAGLIKEGNAVYLDTGSTAMEIAEALRTRKNIAVLTHSLPVQNILSDSEGLQLIAMPGIYDKVKKGFFGDMTCRKIRSFQIDIAFIGCSAVDIKTGVMSPDFQDQAAKKAIIERSSKKVLAIDHTKIGNVMFTQVCPINALDMIVTDKLADKEFVEKVKKFGVEVIQV